MAFFDWDGNGKKDFADDFIEYNIYKECTKDDNDDDNSYSSNSYSNNSSNSESGCALWFWGCIIMIIIGIITN